jgi:hypothetical protein
VARDKTPSQQCREAHKEKKSARELSIEEMCKIFFRACRALFASLSTFNFHLYLCVLCAFAAVCS